MAGANDITDELTGWNSPLAGMPRQMPYAVPEQYFENFTGTLHSLIAEDTVSGQLKGIDKMPYVVPQGYFEQFAKQVFAGIAAEELVKQIPKTTSFDTPTGYFEFLPAQILAAAKTGDNSARPKRRTVEWNVRWAAAAILLICIGIGSYKSVVKQQQPYNTEKALSALPSNEINDYVQQNIDDFDVDMIVSNMATNGISIQSKQLNNKEIIDYLNENGWQDVE